MELNHLRYFYEVARAGSFTEAARTLYVSQPSLSKAVSLLEEREGIKLLERSKSGVTLTSIGSLIYIECEKIFSTLQGVKDICQGTKELCHGSLSFAASDHIATYLLPEKIARLTRKHPLVNPSVFVGTPNEIVELIVKHEVEFGLFFTKIRSSQITYTRLMPIPMAAVCHPKFISYSGKGRSRVEKLPENYIGSIKRHYAQYPAQEILENLKQAPKIRYETNSQELQKRLCLEGVGMALLARFMVEKELASGQLVEVPGYEKKELDLVLAARKSHQLSLNARTFLAELAPTIT